MKRSGEFVPSPYKNGGEGLRILNTKKKGALLNLLLNCIKRRVPETTIKRHQCMGGGGGRENNSAIIYAGRSGILSNQLHLEGAHHKPFEHEWPQEEVPLYCTGLLTPT